MGQPLYKLFGLNPARIPPTSFTIGIDEPSVMAEQAKSCGYPILKIKLGSPNDEAILAAIRKATGARNKIIFKPLPQDDPKQRQPDIRKARKLLKWQPKVPLEKGITQTIEYFRGRV